MFSFRNITLWNCDKCLRNSAIRWQLYSQWRHMHFPDETELRTSDFTLPPGCSCLPWCFRFMCRFRLDLSLQVRSQCGHSNFFTPFTILVGFSPCTDAMTFLWFDRLFWFCPLIVTYIPFVVFPGSMIVVSRIVTLPALLACLDHHVDCLDRHAALFACLNRLPRKSPGLFSSG